MERAFEITKIEEVFLYCDKCGTEMYKDNDAKEDDFSDGNHTFGHGHARIEDVLNDGQRCQEQKPHSGHEAAYRGRQLGAEGPKGGMIIKLHPLVGPIVPNGAVKGDAAAERKEEEADVAARRHTDQAGKMGLTPCLG